MTSQGQRFRRRALRRGYKVDEVDAFLDRVEATLAGEQVGPPVGAQEVHDVVFRVRFGGYDEWQVDLHLDRVERQLAEFEERGGRPADSMRDSMRSGLTAGSHSGPGPVSGPPSMGPGPGQGFDRGGFDRGPAGAGVGPGGQGGMQGQLPQSQGYPGQPQGFPGQGGQGMPGGMGGQGMNPAARMASPPTERLPAPVRDDRMMPPQMPPQAPQRQQQLPPGPDPYGRYDEPTGYGQQQQQPQQPPQRPGPPPGYDQGGYGQGGYDQGGFDGFEPGRHGKADMTAEIRMPDRDPRGGYGQQQMPSAPMPGSPMAAPGSPMPGAPMSGPPYGGGYGPQQPQLGPPLGEPGGELYRVDQLRRTFQPRRFGSGYDPMQVDRLFEGILQAMTGRGPMPVNENDLDMLQFGLVPNGYFEAEVDAALREVKDILLRRR
ncbi:DivIVA domain-containing protein [Actinoplanes sp. NEAU-A12]|uniref:DivIVA domain-containing protein n=1 Tax=Actinoplanes sandaracinus TaxID=3045177 RepID=A0ABT6WD63_9ACTN|nr:DivIVA domain-containing protein [Actinoplanes sandaracinus]MDI6097607.1 DivIVA domain-containing protein [Actinoplanes sandaracinus]